MATARPKQARRRAGAAPRSGSRTTARPAARQPQKTSTHHRRELAAIACVALAVFLAFVLYLGWDGGSLGRWLGDVSYFEQLRGRRPSERMFVCVPGG